MALQGGCQHFFGEPILPPPLQPSFVGRHLGPDPYLVLSVLPNLQRAFSSPQEKGYLLLTKYCWGELLEESQPWGPKAIEGRLFSDWANLLKGTGFPVGMLIVFSPSCTSN